MANEAGGGAVRRWLAVLGVVLAALAMGCTRREAAPERVVVYTALDREYSEPILKEFEQRTGIRVDAVYDAEASKTVGLVNRLYAEQFRPVCDVFWNNEVLRSIDLARNGMVEPYVSPNAADIPAAMKDPKGMWAGFGARARVFIVNTTLMPDKAAWPRRIEDLANPAWKGRAGVAKPLFGTTNTHAAVMLAGSNRPAMMAFWADVRKNAVLHAGNAMVRDAVANGEIPWGLTDTDDAHGAILDGKPVAIVYPEGGPEGEGTLLIPNSVLLVKGAPNAANARKLIDFLLSREVEAKLAASRSAQLPVRAGVPGPPRLEPPAKVLAVDWPAIEGSLAASQEIVTDLFGGG